MVPTDRFNKGVAIGVLTTLIGVAGAVHFDSVLFGIGCGGIVLLLIYSEKYIGTWWRP